MTRIRVTTSLGAVDMKKKLIGVAGAAIAEIALVTTATPAVAADWPMTGFFTIDGTSGGGALWKLSEYGIAGGNSVTPGLTPDLWYPNELYVNGYFFCGDTDGDGSSATVTDETNGDVTIDCVPSVDMPQSGLTSTMHIRLYAESPTGYLARIWVEMTNTTVTTVDMSATSLALYYFYNYYGWTDNVDPWESNTGVGFDSENGDVWGAGGSVNGDEIATSAAWGDPCHASEYTTGSPEMYFPAGVNVFAPGETKNVVTFMNMVFPATPDASGAAAAFNTAVNQAKTEYAAGLTGRLSAGLPDGLSVVGWQTGGCSPELPNTGIDSSTSAAIAIGVSALAAAGLALTVVSRRRRAHVS
jgi:LPXTG-motif cell wall-anchored protein